MNPTPQEMWDKFVEELNRREPLKDGDRHTNFIGSIAAYRKIFLAANTDKKVD